jgi:hypothetical protein
MYMYKSKELWRGPESIYTLKQGLCVAHDSILPITPSLKTRMLVYLVQYFSTALNTSLIASTVRHHPKYTILDSIRRFISRKMNNSIQYHFQYIYSTYNMPFKKYKALRVISEVCKGLLWR